MSDFSISGFRPTGNPEADAQNYANANGISLDEAKTQLKVKFGDPQQLQMFGNNNQVWSGGMRTPIPMMMPMDGSQQFIAASMSPQQMTAYVSNFASVNGISEKDAAKLLGLPDRNKNRPSNSTSTIMNEDTTKNTSNIKITSDYTKKEIKTIQKEYEKNIKEFVKAHKKEYKEIFKDRKERMTKLYNDAAVYAENKWKEANPGSEFPDGRFKKFVYVNV